MDFEIYVSEQTGIQSTDALITILRTPVAPNSNSRPNFRMHCPIKFRPKPDVPDVCATDLLDTQVLRALVMSSGMLRRDISCRFFIIPMLRRPK